MASVLISTKTMDKNVSPWSVEVVTPSDLLISKFEEYDKTKSTAPRLRSFNRAKKWISNLLKRQFKVPEAHRLRHIDINLALQHMIEATAMPGGVPYEDYLRSCLAPVVVQQKEKANSTEPEVQEMTKINEVVTVSSDIIEVVSRMGTNDANEDEFFQDAVNDESNAATSAPTENIPNIIKSSEIIQSTSSVDTSAPENTNVSNINVVVSNSNVSNTSGILKPICKSVWLGADCQIQDCPRAHPPRCKNQECFVLDQGLARWKTLQCRNWHGKPKTKPNLGRKKQGSSQARFKAKSEWPPLPPKVPAWIGQNSTQNQWFNSGSVHSTLKNQNHVKNQWFNSGSVHSQQNSHQSRNFLGNESAPWLTPMLRDGSSTWGNETLDKLCRAMELIRLMSNM